MQYYRHRSVSKVGWVCWLRHLFIMQTVNSASNPLLMETATYIWLLALCAKLFLGAVCTWRLVSVEDIPIPPCIWHIKKSVSCRNLFSLSKPPPAHKYLFTARTALAIQLEMWRSSAAMTNQCLIFTCQTQKLSTLLALWRSDPATGHPVFASNFWGHCSHG